MSVPTHQQQPWARHCTSGLRLRGQIWCKNPCSEELGLLPRESPPQPLTPSRLSPLVEPTRNMLRAWWLHIHGSPAHARQLSNHKADAKSVRPLPLSVSLSFSSCPLGGLFFPHSGNSDVSFTLFLAKIFNSSPCVYFCW